MELSQFTDYALRSLIYVGLSEQKQRPDTNPSLPSVREIADSFQISHSHLVKVVHKLAQLGYVDTFRGRGGGIALARAPREIGVGAVVRGTENLALVECMAPAESMVKGGCCIAPSCELKRVIARARDAFLTTLDTCTLEDLLKPHQSLVSLLHPTANSTARP